MLCSEVDGAWYIRSFPIGYKGFLKKYGPGLNPATCTESMTKQLKKLKSFYENQAPFCIHLNARIDICVL